MLRYNGGRPRLNQAHPAYAALRFSAVAADNNLVNLVGGKRGTIGGSPTRAFGLLGPCAQFSGGSDVATFSGQATSSEAVCTIATIVQFDAAGSTFQVMFVSSQTGGQGVTLYLSNSGTIVIEFLGGGGSNSNFTLTANIPYFIIASGNVASGFNFLFQRLDTGHIDTAFNTSTGGSNAPDGTYQIGNNTNFSQPMQGRMAAIMFSGAALSATTMTQWANDPWAFWYEPLKFNRAVLRSPAVIAGYTPYNPWPQAAPILAQ